MSSNASSRRFALLAAAGHGARMGAPIPKQYLCIDKTPILRMTVAAFAGHAAIDHVHVVVSPDDDRVDGVLAEVEHVTILRCGGESRAETVRNGLSAITTTSNADDWILVHDAARPLLNAELVTRLIDTVGAHPVGGLLALPVVDTVKRCDMGKVTTVSREGLWLAQTPQMFRYELLLRALNAGVAVTDESSAIEALGLSPLLVPGHARNLKVTTPGDLELLHLWMGLSAME